MNPIKQRDQSDVGGRKKNFDASFNCHVPLTVPEGGIFSLFLKIMDDLKE